MVNPGMNDCTKTSSQQEILWKTQKDVTMPKPQKEILKPKYKLSGGVYI